MKTDRTAATRMRRYRARLTLVRAIHRALDLDVDVLSIFRAYLYGRSYPIEPTRPPTRHGSA